jgi:hypothetical protein
MTTVYVVRWYYKTDLLSNKWLHLAVISSLILQLFLIYGPFGAMFGVVPLMLGDWAQIGIAMTGYLGLVILLVGLGKIWAARAKK